MASQPGQRSQLPQLASQPTLAGEGPVWLRKTKGNPGAEHRGRSLRNPRVRARQGPTGGAPGPRCLSWCYLLACGGVPEQPASPGAVSPRSCPCWLLNRSPCTGDGRRPAAPRCCPKPRRPGVNGSRSTTSGAPGSPSGRALPDAGFATNFAGQGRGRWPGQGGPRQWPARDQPAGGAEGGGGHRRSYSWIARGSQLGPAPRSLSVTCLTPPRPGPVPFLPLGVPVPPPPAVPGAHVTDSTAPRAGPGFLIGFPPGAYRPSAPPSQVPALPSVSRGERPGIMRPQPPRLRAQQSLPLLVPRPGPGPALRGGAVGSLEEPPGPEPAGT